MNRIVTFNNFSIKEQMNYDDDSEKAIKKEEIKKIENTDSLDEFAKRIQSAKNGGVIKVGKYLFKVKQLEDSDTLDIYYTNIDIRNNQKLRKPMNPTKVQRNKLAVILELEYWGLSEGGELTPDYNNKTPYLFITNPGKRESKIYLSTNNVKDVYEDSTNTLINLEETQKELYEKLRDLMLRYNLIKDISAKYDLSKADGPNQSDKVA
jgi:hypothetical protein